MVVSGGGRKKRRRRARDAVVSQSQSLTTCEQYPNLINRVLQLIITTNNRHYFIAAKPNNLSVLCIVNPTNMSPLLSQYLHGHSTIHKKSLFRPVKSYMATRIPPIHKFRVSQEENKQKAWAQARSGTTASLTKCPPNNYSIFIISQLPRPT